ncbi:Clp protease N-terminal domain-containing protein [Thermomonospora umbrina]|uniref:ClpA/ClpB-like protein n=1 Tax=Thermomonospora umbrina TaxID=111806 RepID=A0A3D9SFS9_9ACTN|nr:Clp protease N-terminal domain-containing protein [Thermomonospora umbrina]REE94766.1 ClpA/ClpB-like protein [Thermomonospora umbrina]
MARIFDTFLGSVMERGADEARRAGSATIEAEHLLLAIAAEQEDGTRELLDSVGLDHAALRDALEEEFRQGLAAAGVSFAGGDLPGPVGGRRPSKVGESAKRALERGVGPVGRGARRPAHLLLGILSLKAGTVPRALALAGVDRADLARRTQESLPDGE